MEFINKKKIIFLLWILICPDLYAGWDYRSDYFPLIRDVTLHNNRLYFIVADYNLLYLIEKKNNKFNDYKYPIKNEYYFIPDASFSKDSTKEKIFIKIDNKELSFDLKSKTFEEYMSKSSSQIKKEEKRDDTLETISKEDLYKLLPPLCLKSFLRLRPKYIKSFHRDRNLYEKFITYDSSIGDKHIVGNKIWFSIDSDDGEGFMGAGGIGYYDYHKNEIGIARIPELTDYGAKTSLLLGKNIWIAPANSGEAQYYYANYLVEFNTETGKYRIYDLKNTAFRNFGITKIFKLDKNNLCFLTGNEAIIYNLKNHNWERYTMMLKVIKNSAQIYYHKSKVTKDIFSKSMKDILSSKKIRAQYVKKGEILYPIYFLKQEEVEIETPFHICGETSGISWGERNLKIKNSPIWNILDGYIYIKKDNGILFFYASPIESVEKIEDSIFNICIKGAFINREDVNLTVRKTKEGIYPLPEWKSFSKNPFLEMKREVKRMWKEFEECKEHIQK